MGEIRDYRDLVVWQQAMDLVVRMYRVSEPFPRSEVYGLTSQLRRAAVSVPANIAEGHSRSGPRDYLRHLSIAYASLMELETHVQIAERLGYFKEREAASEALEVTRELSARLKALMGRLRSHAA